MTLEILEFTSLVLRIVFSIVLFYIAILFFYKLKRAKGTGFDLSQFFGLGIFALFTGVMEIIFTYYYYFIYVFDSDIFELYFAAQFLGNFGLLGLVFLSEKMFKKTRYVFTIVFIGATVYNVSFLRTIEDIQIASTITQYIMVAIVLSIFIHSLIVKTKGEIRRKMAWALIGFLGILFFYMLDTELGQSLLPLRGNNNYYFNGWA